MSKKSNLKRFQTITSGDMSLSSLTSSVTSIEFLDNVGFQLNFTGSPVGTFSIQVCMDYDADNRNAGTWTKVSVQLGATAYTDIPASLGSPIFIDLNQLAAPFVRLVYTKTSGTGTLNAFVCGKVL